MSGTIPYSQKCTDLLSERVGGKALACSDEWFAECANLVKHDDPVFKEGHFVSSGQWMDGWESRRSFGRADRTTAGSSRMSFPPGFPAGITASTRSRRSGRFSHQHVGSKKPNYCSPIT